MVFEVWKKRCERFEPFGRPSKRPPQISCRTALQCFLPTQISLLAEWSMEQTPDVISFNSAITACERALQWQAALQLLEAMGEAALQPNRTSFNAVISACETRWPWALALLAEMGEPDVVSFSALASAYEKASQWARALLVLEDARLQAVEPNEITYYSAVSACLHSLQWQEAFSSWDQALHNGFEAELSSATRRRLVMESEQRGLWQRQADLLQGFGNAFDRHGIGAVLAASAIALAPQETCAHRSIRLESLVRLVLNAAKRGFVEELQTGDIEKARAVYDALLKVVPHKQFSFAKIWKLYAEFEVRQLELDRARKIYGRAIAECQKERIFLDYADLEMRLGNIDRCRTIYGKFLEVHPHNPKAWTVYVDLEDSVGEIERARALCNLAITQERLDMPELVWKRFIDLEVDLETVIAKPELGAECAVKNFVLLGDQNAGKSTMLHSFCRSGDAGFMQLSSLLPILSSSFINTRMVPHSLLDDPDEPLSAIRDELPYMDTDIARGLVMLTLENFGFFCQEFGLWNPAEPTPSFLDFDPEVRFVALHFTELGGDHLDRLLRFVGSGEGLEALKKTEDIEDESFWKDMHEVLLGSLRLLRDTSCRCAFFINCTSLFCEGTLQRKALRPTLRKLKFLDEVLGGKEILFYCARTDGVPVTMFDPQRAWDEALKELAAFAAEECGRPELPLMDIMPDSALHWQPDTALDESALKEVVGEVPEEGESAPLLAWLRAFLLCMLRSLGFRLQLVALAPVRNYQASRGRQLCAASVVRNVATLLQQGCAMGDLALAQVAELLLRCAAQARRLEGDTLHCWVTRQDLATHLEDCEAEQQAVPLPEVSALSSWPKVTDVLLRAGICTAMAGEGLPQVTLELHSRDGPVVRIRAMPHETALQASSEVLFVTRGKASEATEKIPEAIGLPFDAEFFTLLTSEATIHAVATHLSFGPTEQRFAFQSPEAKEQMSSIRRRLRQELQMLLRETKKVGLLGRLLRGASDAWQAEMLSEMPNSEEDELQERAQKRLCLTWGDGQAEEIAAQMRSLSEEDGLKVLIQVSQEQLDNARKVWQQLLSKSHHVRVYIAYSDFEAFQFLDFERYKTDDGHAACLWFRQQWVCQRGLIGFTFGVLAQ
ncbi:Crooked neck-like protein 1 (Crooked neck homolog) [Durusdinium trenchii]|uniref:Crooked neck-like protein 1 (Crooked neck homolog) n=1 Tax=Durusdinium trenchii TaxID=1381693 RepID=A0ABP0Q429_9DINO